jgi:hypothetical protein
MAFARPRASLIAAALAATALACGTSFVPARPSEPLAAATPAVRASVERVLLADDIPLDGFGDDSALVVELSLANGGPQPWNVSATQLACVMEIDPAHPETGLSLTPVGGGEGHFPGELPDDAAAVIAALTIPPGQTRTFWVMFRGYRFPDSDLPRRITLGVPSEGKRPLALVIADPARGRVRWNLAPRSSVWNIGFDNTSLYGHHLQAMVVGSAIGRLSQAGRVFWEAGLTSAVLIEPRGDLTSSTSSFAGVGVNALVGTPLYEWGTPQAPRRFNVYAGGAALLLTEIQHLPVADPMMQPNFYGALTGDVGLELAVGALRPAATPFPLSAPGRSLPRWSIRAGYTHWWVGHGNADGYTTGLHLAW